MGEKTSVLPTVVLAALVAIAFHLLFPGRLESLPAGQTPRPAVENVGRRAAVSTVPQDELENWRTYKWNLLTFKYPTNWAVEEVPYRTPAQEAAGEPPNIIGLVISPKTGRREDSIWIGGRQADCVSFPKCFTIGYPIYTYSSQPESVHVFELLIESVTFHDRNWEFRILFPAWHDRLERNRAYKIRWVTTPGLRIPTASISVFKTFEADPGKRWVPIATVPNTGSYDWTVPASLESAGPYLLRIGVTDPMKLSAPALAGGTIRQGWSNPFYIH